MNGLADNRAFVREILGDTNNALDEVSNTFPALDRVTMTDRIICGAAAVYVDICIHQFSNRQPVDDQGITCASEKLCPGVRGRKPTMRKEYKKGHYRSVVVARGKSY